MSLFPQKEQSKSLTDKDHQARPFVRSLLVAGHLLIGQEVGVPQVRAVPQGSLSVLPTQTETPTKAGCIEVWREGATGSTQAGRGNIS